VPAQNNTTELIKERDGRYWIGAGSQEAARQFASQFGKVTDSKWAGPGHYRSDVYIVTVDPVGDTLDKLAQADELRAEGDRIAADLASRPLAPGGALDDALSAAGHPEARADAYTVERRHSGTEDGPLWYVIGPDGSQGDGGWAYREGADLEAADLNKLAKLTDDQRQAVETLRGYCPAPDDYGVAIVGTYRDGSRGAVEARLAFTHGTKPAEARGEMARDYADETGAVLVDVSGDVFDIRAEAGRAIVAELDDVNASLAIHRAHPWASPCGDADALEDRAADLRAELASVNAIGTDADTAAHDKGGHPCLSEDWLLDNLPEGWTYDCVVFSAQDGFTITATDGKTLFVPLDLLKQDRHKVVTPDVASLAHEIADAIVNPAGYADDADESNRRADERERVEGVIRATLKAELGA
jgi:hypothetical protein